MSRSTLFALVLAVVAPLASAQIDETPWQLEVEWELGSEETGVFFTFPNDLVIGADDQIYLSDRREPAIQVFTRSGKEVRTIGQEGQGPGEFTEVTSMLAMPEGGILVHDRRGGRMSQFDAKGNLLRTVIIPEVSSGLMWLAAYDASTDRVAFAKENKARNTDDPILFWGDLSSETLGDGVLPPGKMLDLTDPVYAFTGASILTYHLFVRRTTDGDSRIMIFPIYYTGAWATTTFENGVLGTPEVFIPEKANALLHATKLDLTDEEWRANRGKYNMAMGSYGQNGIHFADIHNYALAGLPLDSGRIGLVFLSEESEMDGIWMDEYDPTGTLLGRHPITHDLATGENSHPIILSSDGAGEVYFTYRTVDGVPIVGRGRLVAQD